MWARASMVWVCYAVAVDVESDSARLDACSALRRGWRCV